MKPLAPEGLVALIAPAGPTSLDLQAAEQWMNGRGYRLRIYPSVSSQQGYFAGSDAVRLQDLHHAFADPEVDAILCLRGGYGTPRLLDRIDFNVLRSNPKPFVGYSDITALHLAISRLCGFVTFHGPLFKSELLHSKLAPTESALWQMIGGALRAGDEIAHPGDFPLTILQPGVANGRLLGGNLSLLGGTLGTPWEIDSDGIILFIEDVNEPLYRVDRLLTHLRLSGKLASVKGVLVGDFAGIAVADMAPLLADIFGPLGIPVLAGWRSGHCDPNLTLPMGAQVRLDASQQRLWLEQDVFEG